jgi:hypothetical protein
MSSSLWRIIAKPESGPEKCRDPQLHRQEGVIKMERSEIERIIGLVLKAVAVGMSVVSIVMGLIPDVADVNTQITLLSVGLAALAVAALQQEE